MNNALLSKSEIVARLLEIHAARVVLGIEEAELLTRLQKPKGDTVKPVPLIFGKNIITWEGEKALYINGECGTMSFIVGREWWLSPARVASIPKPKRGNPMKRLNVSPMFVVAVVVFVASICCALLAVAEPPGRIKNQRCVTVSGFSWCFSAGNAICGSGWQGKCRYCYGSTSAIPNKFCAGPFEGESCLLTGQAAKFCEGGIWVAGDCLGVLCMDGDPGEGDGCNGDDEHPAIHFPCSS